MKLASSLWWTQQSARLTLLTWAETCLVSQTLSSIVLLEYQAMDKVQEPSSPKRLTYDVFYIYIHLISESVGKQQAQERKHVQDCTELENCPSDTFKTACVV
jgi:hypothetical protein